MERANLMLAAVLVAAAGLMVSVATWPNVAREAKEDEGPVQPDEPQVRLNPARPLPKPSAAAKALRERAPADGGVATVDPQLRFIAALGWGSARNQVGRGRSHDGNPEAPMSVWAEANGAAWVLDQVNRRLLKLDDKGRAAGEVPLAQPKPQDVVVATNGSAVVLDRLGDKSVVVLGPDGKALAKYELRGRGLDDPSRLTGLTVDGDDIYVERERETWLRLGDLAGHADVGHTEVPGRPSREGRSWITATVLDGARGYVVLSSLDRSTGERRFARELHLGMPVMKLLLVDTDSTGLIYLAALGERHPAGVLSGEPMATVDLYCVDPADGRPLSRAELPANASADDTFREMTALDSGGVMYLYRTETNAELRRVDCR
jgi:hypothetical protein